ISKMKAFNVFENSQIEESPGGNDEVAELIRAFNLLSSELRQTREKMIAIADPLFAVDNDLKITYFSEAAERFTGFAAKDVAGLRCEDVLKSDLCRYNCIMKVVLETGRPLNNFEASIRTKAGKNIPILLSAAALRDASGNIIGGIEVFKDISVLKSTLRELEQTRDKLSRRERLSLLGQLSGGLAHELNTPLARIKLTLEYLKRAESEGLKMAVPLLSDYF
ncbi:MAG: PAS domain-containing protein, partial [Candidatus Omnitrophica bacterium]|nr:PAS domain-containing protein [Candidatus Omnitrophota bacterium]